MDTAYEQCKGCLSYTTCWFANVKNCPCRKCLIKVMCTIPCDLYDIYENEEFDLYDIYENDDS